MHFKYRKESKECCPKMSPILALVARVMGSGCPAQGLSMPTWWATDARVTGTSRPCGLTILVDHFLSYL